MRVVFRVDAGGLTGGGHLMRCLVLANECRMRGWATSFAASQMPENLEALIGADGHLFRRLPPDLDPASDAVSFAETAGEAADWVVVDHYGLGVEWERGVRGAASRILAIDDLARRHDCDILLDQNYLEDAATRYEGQVPEHAELLLGPGFALLRPSFYAVPPRVRDGDLRRTMVSFGATDPTGETAKAVEALLSFAEGRFQTDLLVDPASLPTPLAHAVSVRGDMTTWAWLDDPAPIMRAADLALGAGGTTAWERCATGLPAAVVIAAENQRPSMRALEKQGCMLLLGDSASVSTADFARALDELAASPARLRLMSQRALEVGVAAPPGAVRVADRMESLT